MKRSRLLDWLLSVNWMAFILSFSIAVPLLFRPFYYWHIDAMRLPEYSGFTKSEIIQAYDEMMDFCVYGKEFSTGVMKYSESGKSHFADVAVLFRLDFIVLAISMVGLAVGLILKKKGIVPDYRLYSPRFKGAVLLLASTVVIGFLCSLDFDRAFVTFHHIFFPGKTNWIFSPQEDEIINVLPEDFFRNCAMLIGGIMLAMCIYFIISENRKLKKGSSV